MSLTTNSNWEEYHAHLDAAKAIRQKALDEERDLTNEEFRRIEEHLAEAYRLRPPDKRITSSRMIVEHTSGRCGLPTGVTGRAVRGGRFAELFGEPRGDDGFASFGEFLGTLHNGLVDRRLRAAMLGGEGASGGFLIPEQHAAMLLDKSLESEIVRPRAMVHAMESDTLKIAGFDCLDNSEHLFGGLVAYWTAEGSAPSETQPKVRKVELHAYKLFCLTSASNELISDAKDFDALLGQAMIAGVGWYLDYAFLRGTGAGQPCGVLNDPALITVAKESGQAAATIQYENLVKMLARLHPACYSNAVWVANPTTIPQLLGLTVTIKNVAGTENVGGSQYAVFSERDGKYTILGRPCLFTEKLPTLGNVGDILLADFSQYSIGMRRKVTVEKSIHPGFSTDTSYYRCIVRCDGRGRWSSPLTPRNGDTLSWCVTLAERA